MSKLNTHYFIALPIQPQLRRTLQEIQESSPLELFKHVVYPEDFHITVAFLGGAEEEQLSVLHQELERVVRNIKPFKVMLEGLDHFGHDRRPRVLYASVHRTEPLERIHQEILRVSELAGFPVSEGEYSPHVTLAKKWRDSSKEIHPDWPSLLCESQEVSSIHLYRVEPNDKPRYKCVASYEFTN
ncbi:RNA 2',3'-cyclic phosphodiesterase [Guptibacillus hwajinpoensis]|uniref:RNA 2',3'-cyclic phosphodiesterase n=1 Tax=Guptibacillus hwajinpoensis TaxID=208199 RepID=UPI0024B38FAC|nr:RNA 2',3'-cyclic phosphodiesterase [Pseudalkalibacillus hwajinpoensis]